MRPQAVEDYLSELYKIYEKQDDKSMGIRCSDIAGRLRVSKASASEMVRKLAKAGYVGAKPYSRIMLTPKGIRKARDVVHNHRLIECFLTQVLGCEPGDVHKEAHALEHSLTKQTMRKLEAFLGNPKVTKDGKWIY